MGGEGSLSARLKVYRFSTDNCSEMVYPKGSDEPRVQPTGLPRPDSLKGSGSPRLPQEGSVPATTTPPSTSTAQVPGWSTSAGHELYRKVQNLPEGGKTGSSEQTPKNPEEARHQGIGRSIDTWA